MTRTRWLIAGSWLLLFWLLAGTVWAPAIQRELERSATQLFPEEKDNYPPPSIIFEGQHAVLAGRVRHPDQRIEAERRVRENVRAATPLGVSILTDLNPVSAVTNEIEVAPYPPGWLLLAAEGKYALLIGATASEFEARDAVARVQDRWSSQGGRLETAVSADGKRFDEAASAETTLSSVPMPQAAGENGAQVFLARLGGEWQRLGLQAPDETLREQTLAQGLTQGEWEKHVLPGIQTARTYQKTEAAREAEIRRQAQLPPPHIFIAVRDRRVLLKGETASLALKRELLNNAISAFPEWKVLDDIRVNPQRRAVDDFGLLSTALLPSPQVTGPASGKSLALGLPGQPWRMLDWQVGGDKAQPWVEHLPKDLPGPMVAPDGVFVVEWLQGNAHGIPTLPQRAQPSFLTLTLLQDRVILAGQLAEEAFRTQLIEAAQRTYGGHALITTDGLLARGTCEASTDVQQTTLSLPPLPGPQQPPVLAFAKPGQVWKTTPATLDSLKPGGLTRSGLLPQDFPAAMAEDTFADAFDHVRDQWQKQPANSTPAPVAPPATR